MIRSPILYREEVKTMRKRPQLTVGELKRFLRKLNNDAPVFLAPSVVNIDEPKETQEFILDDEKIKCVAIEYIPTQPKKGVWLGWAA